MKRLSVFFATRPYFAMAFAVAMLLVGVGAFFRAPVALYPSVTRPAVGVYCDYPGANAREVMNTVAGPIEDQVNGVEGMDHMCASCADNGSYSLTIYFKVGYDRDVAMMKVQSKVQQALTLLPQEVKNTGVTVTVGEVEQLGTVMLSSKSGTMSRQEIVNYAYDVFGPAISLVSGIAKVSYIDAKSAMRVWLDPIRMASMGINTDDVIAAIKAQNVQASLGTVGSYPTENSNGRVLSLISKGRLNRPEEFERIVVRTDAEGGVVHLGDIARIDMGYQDYKKEGMFNGRTGVYFSVFLQPGTDILSTDRALKKKIEELRDTFPGDLEWDMSYSIARNMYSAMANTGISLLLALIVAFLACWLYLKSSRASLVATLSSLLPISSALAMVVITGNLVNLFSGYALIIALPLSVTASAMVIKKMRSMVSRGMKPAEAAAVVSANCTAPYFAMALAIACAMIPLMMIDGVQGMIYRQFAIVLAPSSIFAAITALWVVPVIAARFIAKGAASADDEKPIRNKIGTVEIAILVALGLGAWSFSKIMPQDFIPEEDRGIYTVDLRGAEGGKRGPTADLVKEISHKILKIDGVLSTVTILGQSDIAGAGEGNAIIKVNLKDWRLRDKSTSYDAIADKLWEISRGVPEFDINVTKFAPVPGIGNSGGITILIQSMEDNDPVSFANEMQRLKGVYATSPLAANITCGTTADTPHLRVHVDREKCELMQVPMSTLYSVLQHYLGSSYVNDINIGTQVNRVTVMSEWNGRSSVEDAKSLYVRSKTGDMVPVSALVTFEEELGVRCCYRYNRYLYSTIQFVPKPGVSSSEAIAEIRRLSKGNLKRGYIQGWSDLTYEQFNTRGDMELLLSVAVFMVLLVLVAFYESIGGALLQLLKSVTVFAGAVVAHAATGVAMSLYSWFAILLAVIVVTAMSLIISSSSNKWEGMFAPLAMALASVPLVFSRGAVAAGSCSIGVALVGGFLGYTLYVFLTSLNWRKG